jgi:hypothetical protein
MTKRTADLKAGDRVILAYGEQRGELTRCDSFEKFIMHIFHGSSYKAWEAEVVDPANDLDPTIVCLAVFGWETEIGDTYAHEIIGWKDKDGFWQPIEHTPEQIEMRTKCSESTIIIYRWN